MSNEREDIIILGRLIGTSTGWDEADTFKFAFYEFEPAENIDLLPGDVWINFERGKFEYFDQYGGVARSFDIIDILARDGIKRTDG